MPEPYSPLRYPGGKARLSPFIIEVIKYNGLVEPHYVEPYAGGAGAALRLLFEEYVESITINDADPRIKYFWQAVTFHNNRFIDRLYEVELSVDEWYRQRKIYQECDPRKFFETGFAAFYLNRTVRSGIIHNGGPIGGYNQEGNYKIDARFNREQLAQRIQRIGFYSERIFVSGEDGLSLLKKINRKHVKAKRMFVYLDPPYYEKGPELYLNNITHKQHADLARYLSAPRNFPWVMTYDNAPPIKAIYSQFNQELFSLNYSANQCRKGQEILIYPESVKIPYEVKCTLPFAA